MTSHEQKLPHRQHTSELWKHHPDEHDYPAADPYLSLCFDSETAKKLSHDLRKAPIELHTPGPAPVRGVARYRWRTFGQRDRSPRWSKGQTRAGADRAGESAQGLEDRDRRRIPPHLRQLSPQ